MTAFPTGLPAARSAGVRTMESVPDVVESAVGSALRQRARVETLSEMELDQPAEQLIGALLRY